MMRSHLRTRPQICIWVCSFIGLDIGKQINHVGMKTIVALNSTNHIHQTLHTLADKLFSLRPDIGGDLWTTFCIRYAVDIHGYYYKILCSEIGEKCLKNGREIGKVQNNYKRMGKHSWLITVGNGKWVWINLWERSLSLKIGGGVKMVENTILFTDFYQ